MERYRTVHDNKVMINSPEEYKEIKNRVKENEILLFAQWIREKQYSKHQINDRWYDNGDFIDSTEDIFNIFSAQKE